MRKKVVKHVSPGLMRQFTAIKVNGHRDTVLSKFGVEGGNLQWPTMMKMDMGGLCDGGLEQYLRLSFGNYIVAGAVDDVSVVNFRFSQLNNALVTHYNTIVIHHHIH